MNFKSFKTGPITVTYMSIPADYKNFKAAGLWKEKDLGTGVTKSKSHADHDSKTNQLYKKFLKTKSEEEREKLLSTLTNDEYCCPVCLETMYAPFITPCGHTHCYSCALDWFKRQGDCPLCRTKVPSSPKLNQKLLNIVNIYFEASLILNKDPSKIINEKKRLTSLYLSHKANNQLFLNLFRSPAKSYRDCLGYKRCSNCDFLIKDRKKSVCEHCGIEIEKKRKQHSTRSSTSSSSNNNNNVNNINNNDNDQSGHRSRHRHHRSRSHHHHHHHRNHTSQAIES